jgi:DNA-binding XRE family transcriptional regulator
MTEQWLPLKNIVVHGDNYEVSNTGKVRPIKTKVELNPHRKPNGYRQCSLWLHSKQRQYYVHRLVAMTFIPNPDQLPQVNHKDGNKDNNSVSNLEWSTNIDNIKHAHRTGLIKQTGVDNPRAVLNDNSVREIKELYATGKYKQNELAQRFNVNKQTINNIVRGKSWTHIVVDVVPIYNSGKKGETNAHSKLTEKDVVKIRTMYAKGDTSYNKLAKIFGVSHFVIGSVVTRKSWSHVE